VKNYLARTLRVEDGEWRKVAQFSLLGLLLQAGLGIGFSAGDALFLTKVGADRLPIVFVLTPVVMLVYTPAFSWLTAKSSLGSVTTIMLCLLALGGAAFFAVTTSLITGSVHSTVYYALKLYLAALYISLYTLFWLFVDGYFNVQDGKRLFPLFAAAGAVGTALGAAVVSFSADSIPIPFFFLLWSGISLATLPVAINIRRVWSELNESEDITSSDANGPSLIRAFASSRYALLISMLLFSTLLLTNMAEFQYSTILSRGMNEQELASTLGSLYAACSVFNIFVCIFVFNRLVTRLGVRNVTIVMPVTYLTAFIFLFLTSSTIAACFAFWAYQSVLTSIEYNNQNLLFNALPSEAKRRLRTMIEGLCEPFASCVSGSFLLAAGTSWGLRQLAGLSIIVASVLLVIALVLRANYPKAMSQNMRLGWLNFTRAVRTQNPSENKVLIDSLLAYASAPRSRSATEAMRFLVEIAPGAAARPILDALHTWPEQDQLKLRECLEQLLQNADAINFLRMVSCLHVLASEGNLLAEVCLAQAALLRSSSGAKKELVGILQRWQGGDHHERAAITQKVSELLNGIDEQKVQALHLVRLLRQASYRAVTVTLLAHENVGVRCAAFQALAEIVSPGDSEVIKLMVRYLPVLDGTARTAALRAIQNALRVEQVITVSRSANEFSPSERRNLQHAFVQLGPRAIPPLVVALQDPEFDVTGRSLAARTIAELSPTHLDAVYSEIVSHELARLLQRRQLASRLHDPRDGRLRLLVWIHTDAIRKGLELVLELYALVGILPDFDLLAASLRSANPKVRGNALETIESCVGHRTYSIIRHLTGNSASAHRNAFDGDVETALLVSMEAGSDIEAAAAIEALAERAPHLLRSKLSKRLERGCGPELANSVKYVLGVKSITLVQRLQTVIDDASLTGADLDSLVALLRQAGDEILRDKVQRDRMCMVIASRRPNLALSILGTVMSPADAQ